MLSQNMLLRQLVMRSFAVVEIGHDAGNFSTGIWFLPGGELITAANASCPLTAGRFGAANLGNCPSNAPH